MLNCWTRIKIFHLKTSVGSFLVNHSTSTGLMNFIGWNKAYSVFPRSTFFQRIQYATKPLTPQMLNCLKSQEQHGLRIKHFNTLDRIPTRLRYIGDRSSWVLDLDTTSIDSIGIPVSILEGTVFCLSLYNGTSCDGDDRFYSCNRTDLHNYADAYESRDREMAMGMPLSVYTHNLSHASLQFTYGLPRSPWNLRGPFPYSKLSLSSRLKPDACLWCTMVYGYAQSLHTSANVQVFNSFHCEVWDYLCDEQFWDSSNFKHFGVKHTDQHSVAWRFIDTAHKILISTAVARGVIQPFELFEEEIEQRHANAPTASPTYDAYLMEQRQLRRVQTQFCGFKHGGCFL